MSLRSLTKSEVIIIENDPRHLAYLTSFVRSLRLRIEGETTRLAANPRPLAGEEEVKRKLARNWSMLKNVGCIVLDIDLGEGARESGINWMSEIAKNVEIPIVVVTVNRKRFESALRTVDGLTPFFIIDKPARELPDTHSSVQDDDL